MPMNYNNIVDNVRFKRIILHDLKLGLSLQGFVIVFRMFICLNKEVVGVKRGACDVFIEKVYLKIIS